MSYSILHSSCTRVRLVAHLAFAASLAFSSPAIAQMAMTHTAANPEADRALAEGRRALLDARVDDAARQFEKASSLDPDNATYLLWLGRAYARQAQKANIFRQAGLAKKARTSWQHAEELDPNNLAIRVGLAEFYLQAPGIVGGSVDKASDEANEIAKRNPALGTIARGRVMEKQKKYAEAEAAYRSSLGSEPKAAAVRLGALYQSQNQWDKSFDVFEGVLKKDPRAEWALYHVGKTAALSGQRLDRGEQALLAYLKTTPDEEDAPLAHAHFRLGMLYEAKKDPVKARAEYETALKLNPREEEASNALKKL